MSDIKRTMPMGGMNMGDQGMDQPQQYMAQPMMPKKSGLGGKIMAAVIVIVVILIGLFLVSKYTNWNILNVSKESVTASGWQAVFLTNGQVYFGKITRETGDLIILKDIYYLQVAQSPQPTPANQQNQQNLSLVKLGNELHGPKDTMKINMAQVLFTEELKSDSKVVDAIVRYKDDQTK